MLIISSINKFLLKFPILYFIYCLQYPIKENYITIILYFLDNVYFKNMFNIQMLMKI